MKFDDRPPPAIRLEQARIKAGWQTARAACERFGWKYATYSQHERGERGIGRASESYASAYHVSEGWLLTGEGLADLPKRVPIVGLAGAGPLGSVLFAEGDGNFGDIDAPVNSTTDTKALEVRGDSMHGIASDGWLITYDEIGPPDYEMEGQPCVVWLRDGRVLVKVLQFGRGDGLFDLVSTNAPPMRDVPVLAAALVTNIIPRKAAQKFIRRNPDAQVIDVTLDGKVVSF